MDNKHYDLSDYPTDQQAAGGRVEPVVSSELEGVTFYTGEILHYKGLPFKVAAPVVLLGLNENKKLANQTNE